MNKKGIMTSVWFAFFIFLAGMTLINFLFPEIDRARDAMTCNTSTAFISDGNRLLCLLTDTIAPYWIMLVISVIGGVLLDKVIA